MLAIVHRRESALDQVQRARWSFNDKRSLTSKKSVIARLFVAVFVLMALLRSKRVQSSPRRARIGYFIQISESNVAHLIPLLRALYDSENVYALHFDAKMGRSAVYDHVRGLFRGISDVAPVPENVLLVKSEIVTYRGITMTMNYLTGINFLLSTGRPWDFFVNLSGADYPTAPQLLIRELLGSPLVLQRKLSFVEWKPIDTWGQFKERRLDHIYIDTGLAKHFATRGEYITNKSMLDMPLARHMDYTVAKTSGWFIFSRYFCEYLALSPEARKMMTIFSFSDASDEHYFGSVLWNSQDFRERVVPSNLRSIFFVAPNGSFAMGADGTRSRQHPFFVDDRGEDGNPLFWDSLWENPSFFARKFRHRDSQIRQRINENMLGLGDRIRRNAMQDYSERLRSRFAILLKEEHKKYSQVFYPSRHHHGGSVFHLHYT